MEGQEIFKEGKKERECDRRSEGKEGERDKNKNKWKRKKGRGMDSFIWVANLKIIET